jgi:hypothetical protein
MQLYSCEVKNESYAQEIHNELNTKSMSLELGCMWMCCHNQLVRKKPQLFMCYKGSLHPAYNQTLYISTKLWLSFLEYERMSLAHHSSILMCPLDFLRAGKEQLKLENPNHFTWEVGVALCLSLQVQLVLTIWDKSINGVSQSLGPIIRKFYSTLTNLTSMP